MSADSGTSSSSAPSRGLGGKRPPEMYEKDLQLAYFREHNKHLNLGKYVPEFASVLKIEDFSLPTAIRIANHIQILKYKCVFHPTMFICTVFHFMLGGSKASYAYLYSDYIDGKYRHRYITTCPTYLSADGEYRHRLIPYEQFVAVMTAWTSELMPLEDVLVNMMEREHLSTEVLSYFPRGHAGDASEFDEQLRKSRLQITALISSIWCSYYYIASKSSPNHINDGYMRIVSSIGGLNEAFQESKRRLDARGESDFIDRLKTVGQPPTGALGWRAEAGQKLIVMSRADIVNYTDLKYSCWRELYANILCSELLLNYYLPSVPMFLQYFMISNSNKDLFDNEPQHRRYINSEVAGDVINLLKAADERNFMDPMSGAYRGPKFLALSKRIREIMRTEGDAAKVVDVTLGLLTEHTGRTIGDALILMEQGSSIEYAPMLLESPDQFRRYMFEFMYTLHCFNYKQKVIHADLHINNATIYRRVPKTTRDLKIVYIMDMGKGKPNVYCLPYSGAYACVIDMSRCILGDQTRIARDFSEAYAREFIIGQGDAIARMFSTSFSELYKKYSDRLMDAVRWKFDISFKVLCAHDGYRLTNEIYSMLLKVQREFSRLKIHPDILRICAALRDDYADWYNKHLELLTSGDLTSADQVPWVHAEMIKKHMEMYYCETPKDVTDRKGELADVFSMMQPLSYSLNSEDRLNPLLRLDTVIEQKTLHGMDPSEQIADLINFKKDSSSYITVLVDSYRSEMERIEVPTEIPEL